MGKYTKGKEEPKKDPLDSQPVTSIDEDENGNVIYTSIAGADLLEGKYYLDEAKTKLRVDWSFGDEKNKRYTTLYMNPDEWLSNVIKMLPYGLIDKQATGIGATHLELHSQRSSIIVTPTRALALNKKKDEFLYVGTKEDQRATSKAEIKAYLNNANIQYKKILVVADSIDKVIEAIKENNENVYANYFLMVDEIDTLQSDNSFRPALSRVIDHFFNFKKQRRALLSATVRDFTHPDLQQEPLTTIKSIAPLQRNIDLFYTNNINSFLAEKIKEISNNHPTEKILIAYNSVLNIRHTIELLPEELKAYNICAILCSEASNDEAGNYFGELTENYLLPCRINFMTCTYFIGLDIKDDYHLITVSNCEKVYSALPVNKIIQIYGRCRKPNIILSDTILYNNTNLKYFRNLKTYRENLMKKAQKVIDLLKAANTLKESDKDIKDLFDRIHKAIVERATERLFNQQSFELVRDTMTEKPEISYFNIDALYEKMEAYSILYSSKKGLYNQLKKLYPATKFNNVPDIKEDKDKKIKDNIKEESNQRFLFRLSNIKDELTSMFQSKNLDNRYLKKKIRESDGKEKEFYIRIMAHHQYYDIIFLTKILSDIALENKKKYRNLNNTLIFRALEDNHPFKLQIYQAFKEGKKYSSKDIGELLGTIIKDQFFKTLSLSQKRPSLSMLMNLFNSCVDSTYTRSEYLVKGYKPKFKDVEIPEPLNKISSKEYATNYFKITTQSKK